MDAKLIYLYNNHETTSCVEIPKRFNIINFILNTKHIIRCKLHSKKFVNIFLMRFEILTELSYRMWRGVIW
jgi:hypothetical protein